MRFRNHVLWILAFSLCCAPTVWAQDADPQDSDPELPDIAPHEIEIRGQLEISFPELERQPLVGFNPPPRVPPVPDDHRPFIEEYRQDPDARRTTLPGRDDLPRLAERPAPNVGELEAQIGRYYSRIGRARFDIPLTERQRFSFDIDYEGQDRFTPFQDTTFAPHDIFDGHVSFSSTHNTVTWGLDGRGQLDRFSMHNPFAAEMGGVIDSRFPLREHYGGGGSAWLRFDGSVPASFEGSYGEHFFDRPEEAYAPPQVRERSYSGKASIDPRIGGHLFGLSVSGSFADQFEDGADATSLGLFEGAFDVILFQNNQLDIRAGAHAFAAGASDGDFSLDDLEYFASPFAEITWQPSQYLSVYGQNVPSARKNSWVELFNTNPYLDPAPHAEPSVMTVDAESGITLHLEPAQINLFGGYRYSPNFRYFTEEYETGNIFSPVTTGYGPATILRAGGDFSVNFGDTFHASIGGSFQDATLDELNWAVPYEAGLRGHGMISWRIADKGLLQATVEYLDSRRVSTEFIDYTNQYLSMDIRGVYDFTPNIGIVLEVQNIGPESMQERWNFHPNPPLQITSGLRMRL